ncbi:MAG TPA: PilZ domain-containing protein [Rhizomicrobium sp.]|nr:PilZ domain-containing protein [Rhizomicrobium sp.]
MRPYHPGMSVPPSTAHIEKPPAEHRGKRRRRVLLSGLGYVPQTLATFDCTIRDLSETGARITVRPGAIIPTHFLLINIRDRIAYEVQTIWRRESELGLTIARPIPLAADAHPDAGHLRRLWLERANR